MVNSLFIFMATIYRYFVAKLLLTHKILLHILPP
jgi:hypothetical protein